MTKSLFKVCKRCKQSKSIDEYYIHAMMADGYLNFCKECTKKRVRSRRAVARTLYQEYDRKRAMLPHRVAARKQYALTPAGKASRERTFQRWLDKHPERRAEQRFQRRCARRGELIKRPCAKCGSHEVQAHHDDYSKPLKVKWFCAGHHREADIKRREAER